MPGMSILPSGAKLSPKPSMSAYPGTVRSGRTGRRCPAGPTGSVRFALSCSHQPIQGIRVNQGLMHRMMQVVHTRAGRKDWRIAAGRHNEGLVQDVVVDLVVHGLAFGSVGSGRGGVDQLCIRVALEPRRSPGWTPEHADIDQRARARASDSTQGKIDALVRDLGILVSPDGISQCRGWPATPRPTITMFLRLLFTVPPNCQAPSELEFTRGSPRNPCGCWSHRAMRVCQHRQACRGHVQLAWPQSAHRQPGPRGADRRRRIYSAQRESIKCSLGQRTR